jgi:hypothetical protein
MDKLFDLFLKIELHQSKNKKWFSTVSKSYNYMPFEGTLIVDSVLDQIVLQMLLHPGQPFAIQYDSENTPYISFLKEKTLMVVDS